MTSLLNSPVIAARALVSGRPAPRRRWMAPTAVGLLAFAVSVIGNWIPSVWYDEAATISSATRTWAQLFREIQHVDAVHAVYYGFMHLYFDVVGYSPFTLRLPSALAVGATAALLVLLVRSFDLPRVAVLAGLVYAFLPRVTWAGGEGRSYAISALLAVVLTIVLLRAIRSTHRWWWVLYAAVVVVSTATFVYLALVVLSQAVIVATLALRQGRVARSGILGWLIAVTAGALVLSPFVLLLHSQTAQVDWITPLGKDTWRQVYATQWFRGTPAFAVIGWALLAIGCVALLRRVRGLSLGLVAIPGLVLPTVALLVLSVGSEPMYSPRYLTMSTPFVAIVLAAGIARLTSRRALSRVSALTGRRIPSGAGRWVSVGVILVIAALTVPHLATVQRAPNAKQNSTWSQVADLVSAERAADGPGTATAIIWGPVRHHATATSRVIEYAYPAAFAGTTDVTQRHEAGTLSRLWGTSAHLQDSLYNLKGQDVTYLITSTKQDWRPSVAAALGDVGWHVSEQWTLGSVNVVRYERG